MELIQVANFLNGRFLLSNIKSDKNQILKGQMLSSYSVGSLGSVYNEKVYYDTEDFFFAEKGINIYTVNINGDNKELIIRYDSEQVTRIEFLKNIPNFFKMKIGKKEGIENYYDSISEAIYKVYPTGLNVDIEEYLRKCKPQVKVFKKRDSYRVVNNTGLKMTISFDIAEYSKSTSHHKVSQPTLDIVCEAYRDRDDFKKFMHDIVLENPKLIKIESNELTVARKNLE